MTQFLGETAGSGIFCFMHSYVDEVPDKALEQIDRMHYADPYIADGRTVVKLGVQFSTKDRNIRDWKSVMV